MKKIILGIFAITLPVLVFVLIIKQPGQRSTGAASFKPPAGALEEFPGPKAKPILPKEAKNIPKLPSEELFKEFSLPGELKQELAQAQRKGTLSDEWGKGEISKKELAQAGLNYGQIAAPMNASNLKNIAAGFSLADGTFTKYLNLCLPDKTMDSQSKTLNSDALSVMGFSALTEGKLKQAQAAFTALIRDYPDSAGTPIAQLELARLNVEQGRLLEAQNLVEEAVLRYGSDKEYLTIAQSLKNEIRINE